MFKLFIFNAGITESGILIKLSSKEDLRQFGFQYYNHCNNILTSDGDDENLAPMLALLSLALHDRSIFRWSLSLDRAWVMSWSTLEQFISSKDFSSQL